MAATRAMDGPLAREERRWGLILCAPWIAGLVIFAAGPILFSWALTLFQWDNLTPPRFIGADNWRRLFTDPLFWQATRNTIYFTALSVPSGVILSLLLAMLVNRPLRGMRAFRTMLFVPVVTSVVAVALVWTWFYDPNYGLLNFALERGAALLGMPPPRPIAWLNNPSTAMPAIVAMSVWKGLGYNMVIFLAALQGVPRYLYEAAEIDGAGPVRRFFHVTLPTISPITFFVVVISMISSFQVFDQVYIMARDGRPANSTLTIVYYLYKNAFQFLDMGYSSAIGSALFVMIFGVTLAQLALQKRWVHT